MATVEAPRTRRRAPVALPTVELPRRPDAGRMWSRALGFAAVVFFLFLLDSVTSLLMNYWFLDSIGFRSVFWTNFKAGAVLFAVAFVLWSAAVIVPVVMSGLQGLA